MHQSVECKSETFRGIKIIHVFVWFVCMYIRLDAKKLADWIRCEPCFAQVHGAGDLPSGRVRWAQSRPLVIGGDASGVPLRRVPVGSAGALSKRTIFNVSTLWYIVLANMGL